MNIDFSPVFLNPDKSFKQPEIIAESILLVKEVSRSHGIKLAMTEWLRKKNIGTSALPRIRELHDYARELSGIGVGREIREEDFLILMERSDVKNLPGKYKHSKYRNYKKNLLKLLNNILLTDINNIDEEVVKDIERSGLSLKMLIEIRDYINGFDFYFRGQMYDESMDKVEDTGKECKIFCIENHAGEMSFKEKKLIEAVNAVKLETRREGKYAVLTEMFKGENNAEFDPGEIEFFVSGSRLDEARKIKHFILKNIGEREYSYRDFTVVCSDDGLYRTLNNLLSASGVPVYSSYNQKDKNIETDVLRLINAGIGQDAATVLNFYNSYLTKEPINFELESITLSSLIEKLTKGKDSDLSLNVNAADKADEDRRKNSFFSFLRTADVKDSKLNVREAVREIEKYYINLNKSVEPEIKFEIYKYLPVLETVFGEEALLSEVVQYLYLILAKKDKKKLNTVRNGVRLSRMTEPAPAEKCLILSGLTEEGFLKDNGTIKILQKENYRKLYTSVYGISPDEALIENLGIFCSGPVEKAVMFIPNWGEEVIQSTYIDKVLESKTYEAEISIKSENPDFKFPELKRKFSYRADDLIKRATGISDIDLFEGGRISRDRFFSVNGDRNAVLKKLSSASRIEQFMTCPAKFAQEMISSKDEIQDQFPFTAGNFYHDVSEVFIRFYRNKELLGHDEFTDIRRAFLKNQKNDLPYEFGKAEFTQARFTDFAKYYTKGVLVSKKAINAEREFSILKGKIAASGIDNKIKELNDIALENDPFCTYKNNKRTEEFIAFLARLILTIGPTPEEVTKTFLTELKFCDMEITEGIKVNTGYIDFMYIDYNRVPVVLDIKTTGKFKEYKDGIADYQIVQLLIYKEAVRRGIEKLEGVNFDVDRSGRKQECDLLQQNYFDGLDPEKITAAYVSQNSPFTEFTFQVFGTFVSELQEKLGQDKGFLPQVNSGCKYCGIGFTCPLNEQSDFKPLENYIPCGEIYYPDYKIIPGSKRSEAKKFIMFGGTKKEAVVDKNVIISACAGAGKTEVLSSKYLHLLISEPDTGLENIVCITFTNKAAGEMKKRIYSKLNDAIDTGLFTAVEKGGDLSEYRISEKVIEKLKKVREEFYDKNLISTFHSFCNSMILKYGYSTKSLEDMDITPDVPTDNVSEEESISFIQLNYEDNFSSVLPESFTDAQRSVFRNWLDSRSILYGGDNKGGFVHDIIGLYHEMKLSGEELVPDRWLKTYAEYEKYVNELIASIQFDEETDDKINYDLTEDEWVIKYAVLYIISALDAHLLKFKKDKGLIELNDFHHTFIRMLDNDGDLKALLSSKFFHIMVDEFQDTNWLQDKIIERLRSDDNSLFIVGDPKQSIYRFQQCDVQIYKKYTCLLSAGRKYFSDNFRSVPELIDLSNTIFGNNSYPAYKIINEKDEKAVPAVKKSDTDNEVPVNFINIHGRENSELSVADTRKMIRMCEAVYVTDLIRKNLERGGKPEDWTILIRKYKHIGYITEAFRKNNIKYSLILKRDLFLQNEVIEFIMILKAAMGAIKSEELSFIADHETLHNNISRSNDIESLLYMIYYDPVYRKHLLRFGDPDMKILNIEILIETLLDLYSNCDSVPELFLTRLDESIRNNSAGITVVSDNSVTIMTVHSAKGLEFENLVIANISESDRSRHVQFNYLNKFIEEEGVNRRDFSVAGYNDVDGKQGQFFMNEYIKSENKEFSTTENANLLYVALTRAKRSLTVMISTVDEDTEAGDKELNWARFLKQFGEGFKQDWFRLEKISTGCFDLTPYIQDFSGEETVEYHKEIVYDLPEFKPEKELDSVTGIVHKDDGSAQVSTEAVETGNFVHLFLSKKIENIYDNDFELLKEVKNFHRNESETVTPDINKVSDMLRHVIANKQFKELIEGGKLFAELNFVSAENNVQGYIDLIVIKGYELIVLDYKTYLNHFPDNDKVKEYTEQVNAYASALSKIFKGRSIKKYLFFIGRDKAELREIQTPPPSQKVLD